MPQDRTLFQDISESPATWRFRKDREIIRGFLKNADPSFDSADKEKQDAYIDWAQSQFDPLSPDGETPNPNYSLPPNRAKQYYEKVAEDFAKVYGMDVNKLKAHTDTENKNWDPKAVSSTGALGVGQNFPDSIKDVEKEVGRIYNHKDPVDRYELSLHYLRQQFKKYGDEKRAIYAYKEGPTWLDRWEKSGSDPNDPKAIVAAEHYRRYQENLKKRMGQGFTPGPGLIPSASAAEEHEKPTVEPLWTPENPLGKAIQSTLRGASRSMESTLRIPKMLGADLEGLEKTADIFGEIAQMFPPSKDIEGKMVWDEPSLILNSSYLLNTIPEMIPDIFQTVYGAKAGGKATELVVKKIWPAIAKNPVAMAKAIKIGSYLGSILVGGGKEGQSTYNELLRKGADETQARIGGIGMMALSGFLNGISNMKILDKTFVNKLVNFFYKGGIEAITEQAEEPAEIIMKILAGMTGGPYKGPSIEEITEQLKGSFNVLMPSFATGGFAGHIESKYGRYGLTEREAKRAGKTYEKTKTEIEEQTKEIKDAVAGGDLPPITPPIETKPGSIDSDKAAQDAGIIREGGGRFGRENPIEGGVIPIERLTEKGPDGNYLHDGRVVITDKNKSSFGKISISPEGVPLIQFPGGKPSPIPEGMKVGIITDVEQIARAESRFNRDTNRIAEPGPKRSISLAGAIYSALPLGPRKGGKQSTAKTTINSKRNQFNAFLNWYNNKVPGTSAERISFIELSRHVAALEKLQGNEAAVRDYISKNIDSSVFDVLTDIGVDDINEYLRDNFYSEKIPIEKEGSNEPIKFVKGWTVGEDYLEDITQSVIDVLWSISTARYAQPFKGKGGAFLSNRTIEDPEGQSKRWITDANGKRRPAPSPLKPLDENTMLGILNSIRNRIKSGQDYAPAKGTFAVMPKAYSVAMLNNATSNLLKQSESFHRTGKGRDKLLSAIRDRAMLFLMYNTGLRNEHFSGDKALKTDQYGFLYDPNFPNEVKGVDPNAIKNQLTQGYPLSPETIKAMEDWMAVRKEMVGDSDKIFGEITGSEVNSVIKNHLPEGMKTVVKKGETYQLTAHTIRKGMSTDMSNAGASDDVVNALTGHTNKMSKTYIENPRKRRDDLYRYHPLNDPESGILFLGPKPTPPSTGGGNAPSSTTSAELPSGQEESSGERASNAMRSMDSGDIPKALDHAMSGRSRGYISRWDILTTMRGPLKRMIFIVNNLGKKYAGKFFPFSEHTYLAREYNLRTASHEYWHDLYRYLFPGSANVRTGLSSVKALERWRGALESFMSPEMKRQYPKSQWMQEGFAEFGVKMFLRDYPLDPATGQPQVHEQPLPIGDPNSTNPVTKMQGEFYLDFLRALEAHDPSVYHNINQVTRMMYMFRSQTAYARGLGEIIFSSDNHDDKFMRFDDLVEKNFAKINFWFFDAFYPMEQVEKFVIEQGGKFGASESPLFAAHNSVGAANMGMCWLGYGERGDIAVPFDLTGKRKKKANGEFIKSLREIINIIKPEKQLDWRYCLAVMSAVERKAQFDADTRGRSGEYEMPFGMDTVREVMEMWNANPEFAVAAKELKAYQEALLDILVEADIMDGETADYMKEMYEHYVPIERAVQLKHGIQYTGTVLERKGGKVSTSSIEVTPESLVHRQSIRGSKLPIIDPIETITKRTFLFVTAAKRHAILRNLVRVLYDVDRPNPQPKKAGDERIRYITQGASRWMHEVFPRTIPYTVSREQLLNVFQKNLRKDVRTNVNVQVEEDIKDIKDIINQHGGYDSMRNNRDAATKIRERIIEALLNRKFSEAEANTMVDRVIAASQKEGTPEQTEKRITREITKVIKTSIVFEIVSETVFIPPEKHTFYRKERGKPPGVAGKETVITVMYRDRYGLRPRHFQINDPLLLESIRRFQNMPVTDANAVIDFFKAGAKLPAKGLRIGATLDPVFIARNLLRDQLMAWVFNKYGYIPYWDAAKGIVQQLGLSESENEKIRQAIAYGIGAANLVSFDRKGMERIQKEIIDKSQREKIVGYMNPINWIKNAPDILRIISESLERGTRLGIYNRAVKNLRHKVESGEITADDMHTMAVHEARSGTLDFGRAGTFGRAMNSYTAFFNANLQGLDKMWRELFKDPLHWDQRKATVWLRILAGVTLPHILIAALFHDDERWRNLQWYWKDLFFNIPMPASPTHGLYADAEIAFVKKWNSENSTGKKFLTFREIPWTQEKKEWMAKAYDKWPVIRIPSPFEVGFLLGAIPSRAVAWYMDHKEGMTEGGDYWEGQSKRYMKEGMWESINNIFIPQIMPTFMATPWEALANYSWFTGRDIVPKHLSNMPQKEQYSHYTTETSKLFARAFDKMMPTGGMWEQITKLNNPSMLEHYVRNWGGGVLFGSFKLFDYILWKTYQEPFVIKESGGVPWEKLDNYKRREIADKYERTLGEYGPSFKIKAAPHWSDIPGINGFVVRYPSLNVEPIRRYYNRTNESEGIWSSLKAKLEDQQSLPKYEREYSEYELAGREHQINWGASKELSRARREISAVQDYLRKEAYNVEISAEEKKLKMDLAIFDLIYVTTIANAEYDKMAKESWDKAKIKKAQSR